MTPVGGAPHEVHVLGAHVRPLPWHLVLPVSGGVGVTACVLPLLAECVRVSKMVRAWQCVDAVHALGCGVQLPPLALPAPLLSFPPPPSEGGTSPRPSPEGTRELLGGRSLDKSSGSDGKVSSKLLEKKKKTSSWYNMLNPTYKSRSEDFKRLFKDLPETERLIVGTSMVHLGPSPLVMQSSCVPFFSPWFTRPNMTSSAAESL